MHLEMLCISEHNVGMMENMKNAIGKCFRRSQKFHKVPTVVLANFET